MPPVLALAFGVVGAAALVRWCVKEVQARQRRTRRCAPRATAETVDRGALPTLRRDPHTGEYRPG